MRYQIGQDRGRCSGSIRPEARSSRGWRRGNADRSWAQLHLDGGIARGSTRARASETGWSHPPTQPTCNRLVRMEGGAGPGWDRTRQPVTARYTVGQGSVVALRGDFSCQANRNPSHASGSSCSVINYLKQKSASAMKSEERRRRFPPRRHSTHTCIETSPSHPHHLIRPWHLQHLRLPTQE